MVSRGEVGLIIANIGVYEGYLSNDMLTIIVGMVLLTTLVTPPLLRWSFNQKPKPTPPSTLAENSTKENL